MNVFEKYLSLWVALCIVAGVALGHAMPGAFAAVAGLEVAKVNLPVAVLIWLMIIPMLLKIDFGALGKVTKHMRGTAEDTRTIRVSGSMPRKLRLRNISFW